jgi:two-component system, sensor histidine kinase and response regulator
MKILVIEDEESLREEVIEMLTLERFQVAGAENGQIGVQVAREYQPDLILCDVMMPEMDGYGVLTALRQDTATAMIPFIFLTARAERSAQRQGMTLGADDYLIKPFTRKELLDAIATQFQKQEAIERKTQSKLEALRSNISLSLPHELHTPLTGIIGMAELLIADFGMIEVPEGLEMLETIRSSAERLYRLTQNFLLYAELELLVTDPARVVALQSHVVKSYAQGVIADVAQKIAIAYDRSDDLKLDLQDTVAPLSELKLKKIIEEIVDNAFKFSELGTPVRVISTPGNNTFSLYVINQGRGITPEQIASIGAYMQFERKLHEQQGSGLGLIIAKRLTELHRGELMIESIPDQETIIRVAFPA